MSTLYIVGASHELYTRTIIIYNNIQTLMFVIRTLWVADAEVSNNFCRLVARYE